MRTRREYDRAFQIVRDVIARWDPYGLIGQGAPTDEFDDEIAQLLPYLQRAKSGSELGDAVLRVFAQTFGEAGFDIGSCRKVGEELYTDLTKAGLLPAGGKTASPTGGQ